MGSDQKDQNKVEVQSEGKFGYNNKLPEDTRLVFMWLCQDISRLDRKWDVFKTLFVDVENKKHLMTIAKSTFIAISEAMFFDIMFAIARLNDNQSTCGHENISMRSLIAHIEPTDEIKRSMKEFELMCVNIEEMRNKRLAHRDLDTIEHPDTWVLERVTVEEIDTVINTVESIVKLVLLQYDNCDLMFNISTPGGPDDFLRKIRNLNP